MIVTSDGYAVEIIIGGTPVAPTYYAHTHCWCHSTLSSGEWFPTIAEAVKGAVDGMDEHQRTGNHAGGNYRKPCDDCTAIDYVELRDDGHTLCRRCWAVHVSSGGGE